MSSTLFFEFLKKAKNSVDENGEWIKNYPQICI